MIIQTPTHNMNLPIKIFELKKKNWKTKKTKTHQILKNQTIKPLNYTNLLKQI